ncbi:MAG TPA: amidohydrolase family protein [Gemmatimonadaceae bacterium]|jgi:imidazolonepropionase-like amidohydrolase|nr:amidohydrolase family protein [Gemmatimonadaceae bacterium]
MKRIVVLLLCLAAKLPFAPGAFAQERDVLVTGGWLFTSTSNDRVRNPGILIRAGKFLRVGGDLSIAAPNAEHVTVADSETVIPGLFDLHAHYAMELFNAGRKDETAAYPSLFLANGVTATFPAGEMDPNAMHDLRVRIENGVEPGPRLLNSGPYFGTARPGWNRDITRDEIYAEVDHWAELGVKGFKAKGITPDELRALIERAHLHGVTVTGHLDSGNRNSVNPRDAILMGIDRIEHFMGGDAFPADKSAYASYEHMTFDTPAFKRISQMYKQYHTYFDATLSAYGYYGKRDPEVFTYFVDEKKFLTPYMRAVVDARPPRPVNEQFENIYWTKRKEVKAFYDDGGADLITLGTDHPSWGEFLTPFSVHRELLSLSLSGIPNAAVLRIATINSARAMGFGDRLGSIETGKWADLVVVRGNPLADIRRTRMPRVVIKAGRVYDPDALMKSVEGKIGPASAADTAAWAPTPPRRRS